MCRVQSSRYTVAQHPVAVAPDILASLIDILNINWTARGTHLSHQRNTTRARRTGTDSDTELASGRGARPCVARERVPRETCILKRKTFEIRTIVVRLREKDGKPAVPACPHARAAGPSRGARAPGVDTTLCRELSAVPSGLSLCRAQSVTLLVAPEALIGVPCLLCARESGARLCLMMARHQEPHDGTVATNFGVPDESRLRLTAPSRSSTVAHFARCGGAG